MWNKNQCYFNLETARVFITINRIVAHLMNPEFSSKSMQMRSPTPTLHDYFHIFSTLFHLISYFAFWLIEFFLSFLFMLFPYHICRVYIHFPSHWFVATQRCRKMKDFIQFQKDPQTFNIQFVLIQMIQRWFVKWIYVWNIWYQMEHIAM